MVAVFSATLEMNSQGYYTGLDEERLRRLLDDNIGILKHRLRGFGDKLPINSDGFGTLFPPAVRDYSFLVDEWKAFHSKEDKAAYEYRLQAVLDIQLEKDPKKDIRMLKVPFERQQCCVTLKCRPQRKDKEESGSSSSKINTIGSSVVRKAIRKDVDHLTPTVLHKKRDDKHSKSLLDRFEIGNISSLTTSAKKKLSNSDFLGKESDNKKMKLAVEENK